MAQANRSSRFQFSLRTLLIGVAVVALIAWVISQQPWNPFANPVAPPALP